MSANNLFSKKDSHISRKQMRGNYRSDPIFQKKILGNSRISKLLDQPGGQKRVHDLFLEKASDGKVDVRDMGEIASRLEQGKVEGISSAKGRSIAKEFLSDNLRKHSLETPSQRRKHLSVTIAEKKPSNSTSSSSAEPKKITPAYFTYRAKSIGASLDAKNTEKKSSFFDAMQSVKRNKQS